MKRQSSLLAITAALALGSTTASAGPIDLFDWGFNIDGTTWCLDAGGGAFCDSNDGSLPAAIDASMFDFVTGLGEIVVTVTGAGVHNVIAFLDHEIDEAGTTFFNESVVGDGDSFAAGQSGEGDEPGFVFGDIFDNFLDNTLDGATGVPPGAPDDASMALGWGFALGAGETATVTFNTATANGSGAAIALVHSDTIDTDQIFFWSSIRIAGQPPVGVPAPGTLALFGLGLLGVAGIRRRQRAA